MENQDGSGLLMVPAEASEALSVGFGGIPLFSRIGKAGGIPGGELEQEPSGPCRFATAGLRTEPLHALESQSEGVYVWRNDEAPPLTLVHRY